MKRLYQLRFLDKVSNHYSGDASKILNFVKTARVDDAIQYIGLDGIGLWSFPPYKIEFHYDSINQLIKVLDITIP